MKLHATCPKSNLSEEMRNLSDSFLVNERVRVDIVVGSLPRLKSELASPASRQIVSLLPNWEMLIVRLTLLQRNGWFGHRHLSHFDRICALHLWNRWSGRPVSNKWQTASASAIRSSIQLHKQTAYRKPPTTWIIWVITFLNCYHALRFFSLNSRFFKSFINVTYAHLATFFSNRCESLQLKNTMSCREVQGHEVAFHDHIYRMTGHLPTTRKKHSKTGENWRRLGNLQREQN